MDIRNKLTVHYHIQKNIIIYHQCVQIYRFHYYHDTTKLEAFPSKQISQHNQDPGTTRF